MIKSYGQAIAVQERRMAAGRRGHAKAVRRFLKREFMEGGCFGPGVNKYILARDDLPSLPIYEVKLQASPEHDTPAERK